MISFSKFVFCSVSLLLMSACQREQPGPEVRAAPRAPGATKPADRLESDRNEGAGPAKEEFRENLARLGELLEESERLSSLAPGVRVPEQLSEERLRLVLEPLREAASLGDPIELARQIARIEGRIGRLRCNGHILESLLEARYLAAVLAHQYVDHDGLMRGLVFAKRPAALLETSRYGVNGLRIRGSLNLLLAAEEVMGSACSSNGQGMVPSEACTQFSVKVGELKNAHVLADGLAETGTVNSSEILMKGVEGSVAAIAAFVSGSETKDLAHLMLEPIDLSAAIFKALAGHEKSRAAVERAVEQRVGPAPVDAALEALALEMVSSVVRDSDSAKVVATDPAVRKAVRLAVLACAAQKGFEPGLWELTR